MSPMNSIPRGIEEDLHAVCHTDDFCPVCRPRVETDADGYCTGVDHVRIGPWRALLMWACVLFASAPAAWLALYLRRLRAVTARRPKGPP